MSLKTMGIFPVEFNVHLIRSLLTVLPNFTFHEHYSTVSSIFRELFHLFHCADWYNGFYSLWIVSECVFVQAGSSCSSRFSSSPIWCCLHAWQSGINAKIYIYFHHKWTKIFRKTIKFHIWAHWWNLPLFTLYALLTEHPPPALTGAVRQVSWTQNSPSERRSGWPLTKKTAVCSTACSCLDMSWEQLHQRQVKEGKEASIKCP